MFAFVAVTESPAGAEWVNYTNTPRPKEDYGKNNGKWHKIEASMENLFGEEFLTKEDWII